MNKFLVAGCSKTSRCKAPKIPRSEAYIASTSQRRGMKGTQQMGVFQQPASAEKPGLYIHVPFCRTKCPYCDFYSITSLDLVRDWMEALFKEIPAYQNQYDDFDSLYLGGGTPSVLNDPDLAILFERVFDSFRFSPDSEITVEANPDDITPAKMRLMKACGVTRISVGVQSLDGHELRFLKRRHTALQAETSLEIIRRSGFSNLSVDLMYGLPGQKRSDWIRTLERTLEHRPEHLSCYQLTPYEQTPLGRMIADGSIESPDEEEQRAFFLVTAERLRNEGYVHYEVSNFAREERYIARHNRKYWRRVPYLGLGPAAHSFRGSVRWWNTSSIDKYCEMLACGRVPVAGSETLTEDQQRLESLYLGLRTREGIDLSLIRTSPCAEKILARLRSEHLVETCAGRIIPTEEGLVVADSLPLLFDETQQ